MSLLGFMMLIAFHKKPVSGLQSSHME